MVENGDFAAHLKMLNVTNLLDRPMILLNFPMMVVLLEEGIPPKLRLGCLP
jgi:hypothetical protein